MTTQNLQPIASQSPLKTEESDTSIIIEDFTLPTAYGSLAAKRWTPSNSPCHNKNDHHKNSLNQSNSPILMLHDSLGSIGLWRDFPQALAQETGRVVIAYDRLGFGESDPITQPIDHNFIPQEAERFIPLLCDFFQLKHFIAFGHSVGGGMAVHIAAQYPERCERLITESAQAFVEPLTRSGIREAQALFKDQKQFDRLARYHGERTQWILDSWINSWLSPDFDHWSLDTVLPKVSCPTLVLHGEEDEYGSIAQPQSIAAGVKGAVQLEILPALHHVPHRENAALVLEKIQQFLNE